MRPVCQLKKCKKVANHVVQYTEYVGKVYRTRTKLVCHDCLGYLSNKGLTDDIIGFYDDTKFLYPDRG